MEAGNTRWEEAVVEASGQSITVGDICRFCNLLEVKEVVMMMMMMIAGKAVVEASGHLIIIGKDCRLHNLPEVEEEVVAVVMMAVEAVALNKGVAELE